MFVDQYGETEDPKRNRLGETFNLRHGMAPQMHRGQTQPNLVRVVERRIDQLDQKDLRDARLVVIAGVARPDSADTVRLLRDYVRQGGQLVIAAGAEFDPAAWNEAAWKDGNGILPLPLEPHALGATPDESPRDVKALSLAVTPMDVGNSAYLQLPEIDPQEVVDLLREPTFFKTIVPIDDAKTIGKLVESETTRIEDAAQAIGRARRRNPKAVGKGAARAIGQHGSADLGAASTPPGGNRAVVAAVRFPAGSRAMPNCRLPSWPSDLGRRFFCATTITFLFSWNASSAGATC